MNKKETTIDDLAGMVQKGFIGVGKRLDSIDVRLDSIDVRLDGVDVRLNHIENMLLRA